MRKINTLLAGMLLCAQACVSTKDTVIPDTDIPVSVVATIKDQYPSATDMKFSTLEEGKVYKVDFEIGGKALSVVANRSQVLNTFEESDQKAVASVISDLNGLDIENGSLSGLRTLAAPGQSSRQVGEYNLRGIRYRLTVHSSGDVDITTRQLSYETRVLEDLPDKIQTYIKERNRPNAEYVARLPLLEKPLKDFLTDKNELTFSSCATYIQTDKSKQYQVLVKFYGITDLPLIFNESGELLWIGSFNRLETLTNFDDLTGGASNVSKDELSYFSDQFKGANEFKDYKLDDVPSRSQATLNIYEKQKGYEFRLLKTSLSSDESWILRYDGNKKLIDSYYSGQRK